MLTLLSLLVILVSVRVVVHEVRMIFGMPWLLRISTQHGLHFNLQTMSWIMVQVVQGLLMLHIFQNVLLAACHQWKGCFQNSSTAGYALVFPHGNRCLLGAIEAATGILMFGWRSGALISVVIHFQRRLREILALQVSISPNTLL